MNEQALTRRTNRREALRLSGMTMFGGMAVGALTPREARAAESNIAYASWIHGHSMQIEYPERLASVWRAGFYIGLEGKPGTENWFHFAIPTPVILNDARLRADSVMLCFNTRSADAFVRDVHVYDGDVLVADHRNVNLSGNNRFVRFAVPDRPFVWLGLGISIGVGFGVEAMDHRMEFVAAGCDFTLREPER